MPSVGYIPNTFEDRMIHLLVDRSEMEKDAISKLTKREIDVIRMKYYELMKTSEIAQALGLSDHWINKIEQEAFRKLRGIILKQKTTVVDSKTGMKENDWECLATSIARWMECQSTNPAFFGNRHGVLRQWAKDIIMWRLTPDERQILLWYHGIMPYPGKSGQEYYDTVRSIHQKILGLLLEDDLVVKKAGYKQRV
ncbi:MAG: hypothetical protein HFH09_03405 [Bacilli bacterium]|jgi:predicted DNA-binding protein (UPF0251 family)|nr:hypothetical protein [Bacilli bacterium]